MSDPVVQVIDEADGEIVYALRIKGASWRPKVFNRGMYTVKVGDPETGRMRTFEHVDAADSDERTIRVEF